MKFNLKTFRLNAREKKDRCVSDSAPLLYLVVSMASVWFRIRCCSVARCECENRHSFWSFPYVCPEPILVKRCILYINGIAKSGVFRTCSVARCENSGSLRVPSL